MANSQLTKPKNTNLQQRKEEGMADIRQFLHANKDKIQAALPKSVDVNTVVRLSLGVLEQNERLLDCDPKSLLSAIVTAQCFGLEIGGVVAESALVPFAGKVVLIPTYQGMRKLARNHRDVSNVEMESVHQGDQYQFLGKDKRPFHQRSNSQTRRQDSVTHAYVVCSFVDGSVSCDSWSRNEIIAHRDHYSQNWKRAVQSKKTADNPWNEDNPEFRVMAMKTVLRSMVMRGDIPIASSAQEVFKQSAVVEGEVIEKKPEDPMEGFKPEMLPGPEGPKKQPRKPKPKTESKATKESKEDKDGKTATGAKSLLETAIEELKGCKTKESVSAVYKEFNERLSEDDLSTFSLECSAAEAEF